MGYLRYYLGNAFVLLGVVGLALGGGWVWLGAATFPLLIVLDLPFQKADFTVRPLRHARLADIPLYLHGALLFALLAVAARRSGLLLAAPSPSPGASSRSPGSGCCPTSRWPTSSSTGTGGCRACGPT